VVQGGSASGGRPRTPRLRVVGERFGRVMGWWMEGVWESGLGGLWVGGWESGLGGLGVGGWRVIAYQKQFK